MKVHFEIDIHPAQGLTETTFAVEEDLTSLQVEVYVKGPGMVFSRLYNPSGQIIGDLSPATEKAPAMMFFTGERASLNAMIHPPEQGLYRLELLDISWGTKNHQDLLSKEPTTSTKVVIFVSTDPLYSAEKLKSMAPQEKPWFTPEGPSKILEREISPQHRYYKGDFHGHTTFSDGHLSFEEAARVLKEERMDLMAMTDHNRVPYGGGEWDQGQLLWIPSFELTVPQGHVNIHGLTDPDLFGQTLKEAAGTEALLQKRLPHYAKEHNVSINHPFLSPWAFLAKGIEIQWIHTLEVLCDPTYPHSPQANDRAVAFLDFLWNRGYRLYGIGGSDSHNRPEELYEGASLPSRYGDPATYVYCRGLSQNQVIMALRKGHSYVARHVSFEIDLSIGQESLLPGHEIPPDKPAGDLVAKVTLASEKEGATYTGQWILNGRVVAEQKLTSQEKQMALDPVHLSDQEAGDYWWLRFGLVDEQGHVCAYVNPIYQHPVPVEGTTTVDALIKAFQEAL